MIDNFKPCYYPHPYQRRFGGVAGEVWQTILHFHDPRHPVTEAQNKFFVCQGSPAAAHIWVGKRTGLDFADFFCGGRDLFPERNDRFCPHRNQHDARNRARGSKIFWIREKNVVRRTCCNLGAGGAGAGLAGGGSRRCSLFETL